MNKAIGNDSLVTLHFSLNLEDGSIVDSNFEQDAVSFSMGDGSLLPSFESKLLGLSVDAEQTFILPAEEAFGEPNLDSIHPIDVKQFKEMDLQEGLVVSFEGAGKRPMPGVVQKVEGEKAIVDFNHPLAGKTILFRVRIIAIADAIAEKSLSNEAIAVKIL